MAINQIHLFSIFLLNGFIIGLLFDFFRILRKTFDTNDIITYVEDFAFWILTGTLILYSIFVFNNGEIRIYMFIGIIFGITIYMFTLSSYIIKLNIAIIKFIKNLLHKIGVIILFPFCFLYKLLLKLFFKPILFVFFNFRKNITNIYKKISLTSKNNIKRKKKAKKAEI